MVLAFLGLAVLHSVTRGMSGRTLVLGGVYVSTVVLGWPLLLISLAGVSEIVFGVRFGSRSGVIRRTCGLEGPARPKLMP